MSKMTSQLFNEYDFEKIRQKRVANFRLINEHFASKNEWVFNCDQCVPLVYPLLIRNGNLLRNYLVKNRVYCAQYWPQLDNMNLSEVELNISQNLVPIPIDHRYNIKDMHHVLKLIEEWERMK